MLVQTKYFGEVELDEEKVLYFENGIMGFEDYKRFTILYDSTSERRPTISWLQCCDMKELALPVINPGIIMPEYNPIVEDEVLAPLGKLTEENIVILLTLTVPSDIKKMTTNLKAPLIINAETKKGCQVIAENQDYVIKYAIYDMLNALKEGKGEN